MATVIDALVTTLGLDSSGMTKGAAEGDKALKTIEQRSEKTSKAVSRGAKDMTESLRGVKTELLGLLAVFGVALSIKGVEGFFTSMTKSDASTGRFAANIGLSAKRLDAFRIVAKEFGDTGEAAMQSLQAVSTGVSEALMTGQSAFVNTARANGIVVRNAHGQFLATDQIMENIGKRLRDIAAAHKGPIGRQLAMNLAGRLGVGSYFNELMDPNFGSNLQHAQGLSGMTAGAVAQAKALQKQWADIGATFDKIKNQIYTAFGPVLIKLSTDFERWLEKVDFSKVAKSAEKFIEGIPWGKLEAWLAGIKWSKMKDDVVAFIDKLGSLVKEFKGDLKPALEILGGLFALKLITPITSVIGLLTGTGGLVTAIGLASAAMAGWKIGTWIEENLSQKHQDDIGRFVAQILALSGDKDAQDALDTEYENKHPAAHPVVGKPKQLAPKQIAAEVKAGDYGRMGFWELQRWKSHSDYGDIGVGDAFDPQHVRGMTNAAYFSALEKQYGLPAGSLASKFKRESANGTLLQSSAGALGPMQFMPKTAASLGLHGGEVYDLAMSADAAARLMVENHKRFGSWDKAAAAYNWNPNSLQKLMTKNAKNGLMWYVGLPDETAKYVNNYRKDLGEAPLPVSNTRVNGIAYTRKTALPLSPAQAAAPPVVAKVAAAGQPAANGATYNIDTVNINTRATDAAGIKKSLATSLASNRTVNSANTVVE